jgi:hypothetical protein
MELIDGVNRRNSEMVPTAENESDLEITTTCVMVMNETFSSKNSTFTYHVGKRSWQASAGLAFNH